VGSCEMIWSCELVPRNNEVRKIIEPVLAAANYELVDLTISTAKRPHICVYIYRDNGITIKDCETVSRSIEFELDSAEFFNRSYRLEVSSPGLDRPLKTVRDFERNIGNSLRVFFNDDNGKSIEKSGIIRSCNESRLVIESDDEKIVIPLDRIVQGKLLY
jgi:ribosome maturation factor RimP